MGLVHTVELIHGFFPVMGNGRESVIGKLRKGKLRIDAESGCAIPPTPYGNVAEIPVVDNICRHILLGGGQPAMSVLHGFKAGNGHRPSCFSLCEAPLYETVPEIVVVLDD